MNGPGATLPARWNWPVAALLLLGYWAVAVASLKDKCTTSDEIAHLTAGCAYWQLDDYRLNPENGNLAQRWYSWPIVLAGLGRLPDRDEPDWKTSHLWRLGHRFFYGEGTSLEAMLLLGRATAALLAVGLAVLVWLWSRSLWGDAGGLVSLAACTLCPTLLAHGPLMTSDTCVTFFLLAAVTAVWGVLHRLDGPRLAACAAALGGLFLAKFSAVLVLPMAAVLVGVRLLNPAPLTVAWRGKQWQVRTRLGQVLAAAAAAGACAAASVALVWLAFGLRYSAFNTEMLPEGRFHPLGSLAEMESFLPHGAWSALTALDRRHVLPEAYLYGAGHVVAHRRRQAFFLGDYSSDGWVTYFPYCFLVKTPWPLFVLLGLAGAALAFGRPHPRAPDAPAGRGGGLWYRTAPLWVLWGVYWGVALASTMNIGHRHILPTYPPLYIAAGAAVGWLRAGGCVGPFLLGGTLLWSALDTAWAFPHYLAYFNPLVRSDRAYRSLIDSNLDWGQDLPGLKKWLSREGLEEEGAPPVYLSYFGNGNPAYYGIRARELLSLGSGQLKGGVYCISATRLMALLPPCAGPWSSAYEQHYRQAFAFVEQLRQVRGKPREVEAMLKKVGAPSVEKVLEVFYGLRQARLCSFLRQREPDHDIGHSILIYRLSDADVRRMLVPQQPAGMPQLPGAALPGAELLR
jgi:hypothetical protein